MKQEFTSSELKTILHSKRANLYYLEYCRVLVNGGRVEYVTDEGKQSLYWNIPIANTTVLLLGTGTSVTQAAMRELAKAGVLVGFSGGGGTPLFSANEAELDIAWFSPQSEYRPTEYLHAWLGIWQDEALRLEAAKELQMLRSEFVVKSWLGNPRFKAANFNPDEAGLRQEIETYTQGLVEAKNIQALMLVEARLTKALYKLVARATGYQGFTRVKRGGGSDPANRFLDQGNYLAYGLGATATWVLGLPHGLSILHGQTRRGGLVFDAADLIKDALVLPQAFISAVNGDDEQEFRASIIAEFRHSEALDFIIDQLKALALGEKA